MSDPETFRFPEPWWDLRGPGEQEAEQRDALARQLRVETGQGHPLFNQSVTVVATCDACDDVLFSLGDQQYAVVHLTWNSDIPQTPPWPLTSRFDSWAQAQAAVVGHEPFWEE